MRIPLTDKYTAPGLRRVAASMVYIRQWDDYAAACQELCLASPAQVSNSPDLASLSLDSCGVWGWVTRLQLSW